MHIRTINVTRKKTANKKVTNAGEIIVNVVYLIMMKANTNWYWKEHGNKGSVIIATCTIVHQCIDVATIEFVSDLPRSLYNKNRHKYLFKCIQFVSLINIMTIFEMKLSGNIKLSMKEI